MWFIMVLMCLEGLHTLTIDNQLSIIRKDCYERMAIGQRLGPKGVYKTSHVNTVPDCQQECSNEKELCKSLSFGIGVKGNATCELSNDAIKETGDLKPIGTRADPDFDLYIKKSDCTLVINQNSPKPFKPVSEDHGNPPLAKPSTVRPTYQQKPSQSEDQIHHVQTLVSIASGPNSILHPIHEILIGEGPYGSNQPNFKPGNHEGSYGSIQQSHPDSRPSESQYYGRPKPENYNSYRPNYQHYPSSRPDRPSYSDYGMDRPNPPSSYDDQRPFPSSVYHAKPKPLGSYSQTISDYNSRPDPPNYDDFNKKPLNQNAGYNKKDELKPNEYLFGDKFDNYEGKPSRPIKDSHRPIVTQSYGVHGEAITSIITEVDGFACFRRVLAGKRVTRALVKRALFCERVEDCQRECAEENRFACEGFNYRLDPSGRSKGECELLSIPLSHLDIGRDLYPDPDYDYYERDRNAAAANCKGHQYESFYNSRPPWDFDRNNRFGSGGSRRPRPEYGAPRPHDYDFRPDDDGYPPRRPTYDSNRRGDFAYHQSSHHSQQSVDHSHNYHYHGHPPYDYGSYEPFLPPFRRPITNQYNNEREKDRNYWGFNGYGTIPQNVDRRNYYLPPKADGPKQWGQYGGTYGTGGANLQYNGYGNSQSFDFWGLHNKFQNHGNGYLPQLPPKPNDGGGYLPYRPEHGLQPPINHGGSYLPSKQKPTSNDILPAEPRRPQYDYIKDDCSLRSATGFRLTKGIVKKFYAVPNIYECELLCFKEKEFPCASYAFRYTISITAPSENCYLSNRNYKELDYYTDLQPDRDFDIYTMNNQKKCEQPVARGEENSECFWRVRSAQRLDHRVVRDSLTVKSIVQCQLECLRAVRFTCRAFSFRYGSPRIGGAIDNCQLTDWPYYELDPHLHFIPEEGFELYERGSFGHGCEPYHFGIRGKPTGGNDHLCYVGFGSPAKLTSQATRKEIHVHNEEECKAECSKLRGSTLFQCMSFSFTPGHQSQHWDPNCKLSDILQRDLLPHLDYVPDADSWLFAWDNYNPQCRTISKEDHHFTDRHDYGPNTALDTWRMYSVSGWPCRRGSLCKENLEAGFWSCELEGGQNNAWDYCCRPDHQCGNSEGFQYQWCYVGPSRTQWRKCSERYYPYMQANDRYDRPYLPGGSFRPDRPAAPPTRPPLRPSLDEYEMQFESQFLDPPRPGGFGQPRHWPLSYLHKEMPPNNTKEARSDSNPKFAAIQNLIDVIKSNDLKNVQYQITNESNKQDDILFVKIPLPTNFTTETNVKTTMAPIIDRGNKTGFLESIDLEEKVNQKRSHKSLPNFNASVYRKSYVSRTNVTRGKPK